MTRAVGLRPLLHWLGRAIGAFSAAVSAVLWVLLMWLPGASGVLSVWSMPFAFLAVIFAVLGVIASIRGHSNFMFAMFLALFLPAGAFLMYTSNWLQWIGAANLGLLAGSLLTRFTAPQAPREEG